MTRILRVQLVFVGGKLFKKQMFEIAQKTLKKNKGKGEEMKTAVLCYLLFAKEQSRGKINECIRGAK